MGKTVLGVFENTRQAEKAVDDLQRRGFNKQEISIVARKSTAGGGARSRGDMEAGQDISGGITAGSAIGGVAGLLAGVGALAIPGIGPVVAAGPIATALSGAVTGGIAGGLIDWGIPEDVGQKYEQRVKEGKIVAMVRTDDEKTNEAADIFRRHGAKDVETH
ncbi:MAG: general stress protein [Bacillota bacterium]|jgi:uncharacterized membrane protein|nr:hypothetical protein [Candidatus Fermentithermobacillaceae bacterium]